MSHEPLWQSGVRLAAFAVLALLLLLLRSYPLRLLGMAAAAVALFEALSLAARFYPFVRGRVRLLRREMDLEHLAVEGFPVLAVLALAAVLLWPCLLGLMPQSQDHTVHLFKGWHFTTKLLARLSLDGWSSYWFAGFPVEELYPPGPDYLLALLRIATLGLLSWEATYALAFLAVFALCGVAVYVLGRATAASRSVGLVAAVLYLVDRGEYREGGWTYTVFWAVWPQILGMAFLLLALAALERVLARGRPRDILLCALAVAAALVSHPISLLVLAGAAPLFVLAHLLAGRGAIDAPARDPVAATAAAAPADAADASSDHAATAGTVTQPSSEQPAGRLIARAAAALCGGFALSAYWVIPFSIKGPVWTAKYGESWKPLSQMGRDLLTGELFANMPPAVLFAALLGAAAAAVSRSPGLTAIALCALSFTFIGSSTAFEQLGLLRISPAFGQIQFQRFTIPAKCMYYLLAALAVVLALRAARRLASQAPASAAPPTPAASNLPASAAATVAPAPAGRRWRRAAVVFLLALAASPFVEPAAHHYARSYGSGVGSLLTRRQMAGWHDYQAFLAWSAEEKRRTPEFYRIAYVGPYNDHFFAAAPVYNDTPAYKVGFTPAANFIHKPDVADPELYRALSVKYVVAREPQAGMPVERTFGSITVYRFPAYTPERQTLVGAGQVEALRFDEERMRFRIRGAGSDTRLRVHVAPYVNWQATQDGRKLPVAVAGAAGDRFPIFMEVPARDGVVELRYRRTAIDLLGDAISLLALLGLALLGLRRLLPRLRARTDRLRPLGRLAERYAVHATLVCLALLLVAVALRGARGSGRGHGSGQAVHTRLKQARVTLGGQACDENRDQRWYCSPAEWNYVGETQLRIGGEFRSCVWAHPVSGRPLEVGFSAASLSRLLRVGHGLADEAVDGSGAAVTLEVRVDGQLLRSLSRPDVRGWESLDLDTAAFAGGRHALSFRITAANDGRRHYCFDAVPLAEGQAR